MTWAGARTAIVDVLDGLAITSPSLSIKRVYEFPPATVQDWPAFILYPPSGSNQHGPSSRFRNYRQRLRLIVSDQDMSQAAAIADAFREVLLSAFDSNVGLSGHATQALIQDWDEVGTFPIAEKVFIGFDTFLSVEVKQTVAFA